MGEQDVIIAYSIVIFLVLTLLTILDLVDENWPPFWGVVLVFLLPVFMRAWQLV